MQALASGIPPAYDDQLVRFLYLRDAVAKVVTGGLNQQQGQVAFLQAMTGTAHALHIKVSPRYGSFNDQQLALGPVKTSCPCRIRGRRPADVDVAGHLAPSRAGVLTWRAWEVLRSATEVLAGSADHPQLPYLLEAGVAVDVVEPTAATLVAAAESGSVIWVAAPDGDEELLRAIGAAVVGMDDPPVVELLHGTYDLPGARLLDLVTVMDTLRRECPWDRKQTHESLVPYLLEESYEVLDTIETGDLIGLREELGDVLMQVAFHSVVAAERTDETRFTIDDVAGGIVDKLDPAPPPCVRLGDRCRRRRGQRELGEDQEVRAGRSTRRSSTGSRWGSRRWHWPHSSSAGRPAPTCPSRSPSRPTSRRNRPPGSARNSSRWFAGPVRPVSTPKPS